VPTHSGFNTVAAVVIFQESFGIEGVPNRFEYFVERNTSQSTYYQYETTEKAVE
jgi:hypothetical protein